MMLKTIFALLTCRPIWGLLGVSALCALIWMLGPLLALSQFQLLDSDLNRQLLIASCYLLWGLFMLLPQLYRAWYNRRMLTRLQLNSHEQNELQATSEMLDMRFHDATQLLKKIQFPNSSPSRRSRWLRFFSARYLYQLPWYLIVGAPGAGKTTALLNSGLEFALPDSLNKGALRGVGGTRHCDWWFTQQAVLLDTAGRYTLQESQRTRDASEWQTFIALLKRYRPRQPINGVIVTLSVADLLSDSAEMRQAQATALRSRMAELHQQTGIHFPVYIMVTKSDLLKGFMSYFAQCDKSQREQVFGFTFPLKSTAVEHDPLLPQFEHHFHQLCNQLMNDLACNMARQTDLQQRADCFLFPQEFASLRPLLAEYLTTIFSPRQGEPAWSIRGLFFTSGTQEGLPFDRVMGELARKLQLPQSQGQSIASWNSVSRTSPIPANKGQSYFIHDLLSKVVFRESALAGSDSRWELRNQRLHRMGYAATAAALVACCGLWYTSYDKNQRYLQQIDARLPEIQQQARTLSDNNSGDITGLLPFLNSLVALPEAPDFSLSSPPTLMRAGLYRGEQLYNASWGLYQNALKSLLLPRVAQAITLTLQEDNGADESFTHDAIRAYQMLYQPRTYDGRFLRGWVMQNLSKNPPPDITDAQLKQLDWHLSQLLDKQIQSSPYARDGVLIMRKQNGNQH